MFFLLGEEAYFLLYNDAYRPSLGMSDVENIQPPNMVKKGLPFFLKEVWPEIWEVYLAL